MGFLAEDQGLFRDPSSSSASNVPLEEQAKGDQDHEKLAKAEATKRKKAIPLYIGLATGFCGSFTSFSSFARDVFLALSNNLPTPIDHPHPGSTAPPVASTVSRDGGYSFEAILHVVISTLALSLGGLIIGAQLAVFMDPITPRVHGSFAWKVVDRAMVVLAFGCWLGAILLAIFPPSNAWRGEAVFALVFAPLGCLLRYYVSLKLNPLVPAFPLGTFAVNMFGSAIEGMCFDIQHVGVGVMGQLGGGVVGCQILQGVMDGFCGCLTTVSTWVAEINGLQRKHGWGYAFGSVLGGLCLMVIIMGSVRWTVGYSDPICNTGYTSKIHG
jgi:fluoride ion exporter CrcB/FEX